MIVNRWHIREPRPGKRRGCVLALPGRGIPAAFMERFCHYMGLPESLVVVLEPHDLAWYPQPNGRNDQYGAVKGQVDAVHEINDRLSSLQRALRLKRKDIAVVGFSAGSVLALQLLAAAEKPFACVASFAGAIFEPHKFPAAKNQTPVLLRHAVDDDCFTWEERYLPMRTALQNGGYNLTLQEKQDGGHEIGIDDAISVGKFVAPHLGYNDIEFPGMPEEN